MNTLQITGDTLTPKTVHTMVKILNDAVKKDSNLAFDLLLFLQERHIEVPVLTSEELSQLIPVSFKKQHSKEHYNHIQRAFEDISSKEDLI